MNQKDTGQKSDLARRVQMRLSELDVVLQELEHAERIKPTEVRGATSGSEATR